MIRSTVSVIAALFFGLLIVLIVTIQTLSPHPSPDFTSDAPAPGFAPTYEEAYGRLVDDLFAEENVTQDVNGSLWVPWYSSSSSCQLSDLAQGSKCNVDVNGTVSCMVTDEFSQVGLLIAMDDDEPRMERFVATLDRLETDKGLPSWKALRNGSRIIPCQPGINGGCDTASDADARILLALLTAAGNPSFERADEYRERAARFAAAFARHDLVHACRPTIRGEICQWLAGGPGAASGGLGANDFTYTGYFPDAITAMLASCSMLDNRSYCDTARNLTENYLAAASYTTETGFRAPPGMTFNWRSGLDGRYRAYCGRWCEPPQWDSADASRAVAMCQNLRYAQLANTELRDLDAYCRDYHARYNTTRVPVAYFPNGASVSSPPDSHYAASLSALSRSGADPDGFATALEAALSHYTPSTGSWDHASCFGVYFPAFSVRALGVGLGADTYAFAPANDTRDFALVPTRPPLDPSPYVAVALALAGLLIAGAAVYERTFDRR